MITNYKYIMETVKNSKLIQEQWQAYQKNLEYAKDVDFMDACDMVMQVMDEITETKYEKKESDEKIYRVYKDQDNHINTKVNEDRRKLSGIFFVKVKIFVLKCKYLM